MRHLPALTVRRKFGEVLDEVVATREPVTITRANRPLVVLVPADAYATAPTGGAVREHRLRLAATRIAEWKARHAARLRGLDPVALIREAREHR